MNTRGISKTVNSNAISGPLLLARRGTIAAAAMLLSLLSVGCTTPLKGRITQLEAENKNFLSQLELTRAQLGEVAQERNRLGNQLILANQDLDAMEGQLASQHEQGTAIAAPTGWSSVPGGVMTTIDEGVLFSAGKADLRSQAAQVLDRIAAALNDSLSGKQAMVFGHTDSQPIRKSGWQDNWQLSTERALAVVRYLKEHGVKAQRLVAAGCGEHRPRSDNRSDKTRASNRRVEIFAVEPNATTAGR